MQSDRYRIMAQEPGEAWHEVGTSGDLTDAFDQMVEYGRRHQKRTRVIDTDRNAIRATAFFQTEGRHA